jgi:hypothetical protein
VILAIDGLQPDVGHEVLWVLRDVLSGEVLLARRLLASYQGDLAKLIAEVRATLPIPIVGAVPDGRTSICHLHYLRGAAMSVYEADRHVKVRLEQKVQGARPIERRAEGRDDPEAAAVRGYCAAARSALTDDARPPLDPVGLEPAGRLREVAASLERLAGKGGCRRS